MPTTGSEIAPVHRPSPPPQGPVAVRHVASGHVLDVDRSNDVDVALYPHLHFGPNQLWSFRDDDGRVACGFDDDRVLGVAAAEPGSRVALVHVNTCVGAGSPTGGHHTRFKFRRGQGMIALWGHRLALASSSRDAAVVLKAADPRDDDQKWEVVEVDPEVLPRPATSCHLRYDIGSAAAEALAGGAARWKLRCTTRVTDSAEGTYFCVVGWGPGGYSGIQELDGGKRVAIFSMWDDGCGSDVEEVDHGRGVTVSTFGGEGTGLKSMRDLDWTEGRAVTFSVKGVRGGEWWFCGCYFKVEGDGDRHHMATFKRRGAASPFHAGGFYSFVEDFRRPPGARGHLTKRRAQFEAPKFKLGGDGEWTDCVSAVFTKVEDGADAFASNKATGGRDEGHFFLSTGGDRTFGTPNNNTVINLEETNFR